MNDTVGGLIDGFGEPPMLMMPYNPPWYGGAIEAAGYTKARDLYAWIYDLQKPLDPRLARILERARERHHVEVRGIDPSRMSEELERFSEIYISAWASNWGFVAPTPDESRWFASHVRLVADARYMIKAEVDGVLAGCAVAVPDFNQVLAGTNGRLLPTLWWRLLRRRRIMDQTRLLLLGVLPEFRQSSVYPLLLANLFERSLDRRYRRVEFSWTLENNDDVNRVAELSGARRYKTYRIYEKLLT